ncbi:hypothetical protein FGG08_004288 [Glutinoglossum americanum]|uniref:Uncharacterized protein n=1 Tax=Glutinoglossum americanum TaxID=1670608 RepID=A0A9P8IBQ3_9PEZI|nr:hypothetical protein FGG08_004288 [Glutinoglossum americanum]
MSFTAGSEDHFHTRDPNARPDSPASTFIYANSTRSSADFSATGSQFYEEDDGCDELGLAISNAYHSTPRNSPRRPKTSPQTPNSADPLLSHHLLAPTPSLRFNSRQGLSTVELLHDIHLEVPNMSPRMSRDYSPDYSEGFRKRGSRGGHPDPPCKSKRNIAESRCNWLSVVVFILAVYSTIFSGIFFLIAVLRPRYGRKVQTGPGGGMSPNTATLLSALFAKTIELSFVTVFVVFLGQVLSRKAFQKGGRGITIAEMSMRSWIMQPGSMFVHWESVRYAALTFLGIISLTAALIATFYTTASEALVAPKLKFGPTENKLMYGHVAATYANPPYVASQCKTPILKSTDPDFGGTTCLQIEHAGQAFHNYAQYLSVWTDNIASGNGSADLRERPKAVALLHDNTTVVGSWIEVRNTTEESIKAGRIINNVTLAMPHPGIFAAAREPKNNILQPEDLGGLGEYQITASVPSPSVNVLCASMTDTELTPFIKTNWPNSTVPGYPSPLNKTVVDSIFGFGQPYGKMNVTRVPPIFPSIPIDFNTILNATGMYKDSIYLLGKSNTASPPYVLCSLRSALSPRCSTHYNASSSGGSLVAHCEDNDDPEMYSKHHPEAPTGLVEPDWANIASEWGRAVSLNAGMNKNNASNGRLLTQLILTGGGSNPNISPKPLLPATQLNPSLPSLAEALAVLAGCTLLLSARDAPFTHEWLYSPTIPFLSTPQLEPFNASIRTQQYASGPNTQAWHQAFFYVVLFLVFVTNVLCLVILAAWRGQVTDFVEPQNMFALAVNSPMSRGLEGSCGGGPEGEQLALGWRIRVVDEHVFLEEGSGGVREKDEDLGGMAEVVEEGPTPIVARYSSLSNKKNSGSKFLWARLF